MRSIFLALIALVLSGCASLDPTPAPPPGGGLECLGLKTDRPTVIFESGSFGGAADWWLVAKTLSASERVCAYDRDGLGRAQIHDLDRAPVAIARRLGQLVEQEEGAAPVILAGHSNGGLYIEAFARLYPERTAGLLLVDAVGTDVQGHPLALADLQHEARISAFAPFARAVGLTRLEPLFDDISPGGEAEMRRRRAWTRRESIQAGLLEEQAFLKGLPAVDALPPLPRTIPIAVLVASRDPNSALMRDWRAAQVAPADRACRSVVVDAWASHTSLLDAQRDYAVDLVGWLNGQQPWAGVRRC